MKNIIAVDFKVYIGIPNEREKVFEEYRIHINRRNIWDHIRVTVGNIAIYYPNTAMHIDIYIREDKDYEKI